MRVEWTSFHYDTCIQGSPEIDLESQDLGENCTHNLHNSGVTALHVPVELPSTWKQGGGELGICVQVLLVPYG